MLMCGVEAKPSCLLFEIPSVTMGSCKVKSLMDSNMALTVLNLHQKTPKGATTKIQVKGIKRDTKIIIFFFRQCNKQYSDMIIQRQ